ncbi:VOC family protein [Brevibacterium sp.]|uniref:VOC family protein n=1 Tax=Brevibacterium sp. TaxID=1701 RepID=UPI00260F74FE|nr:VOC family protein [Brevibacterium sp.]
MSLEWEQQIIIDSPDPLRLGRWWARALDWVIVDENDTEIEIRASADRLPGILIGVDREEKVVKNRLHLDFRPDDQAAEVARFLELGARHVDVGQTGDGPWVVLADPEGNEFCILSSAAD